MMPNWPTSNSMPQVLPLGTKETSEANIIASEMDIGPPRLRQRFTSTMKFLEVPPDRFVLTNAQKDDLLTFHDTTCKGGSLAFNWGSTGPLPAYDNTTTTEFRFGGRPEVMAIVGGSDTQRLYSATMTLVVLP